MVLLRRSKSELVGMVVGYVHVKQGHQFSAVVDEDYRVRSHIPERVGYIAFERKINLDYCTYFPQPAVGRMTAN
ncbi:hypothetical protein [Vibrio taketomensis]|uniref:hypothetical protein n=1 Tax=Vibrio taketomensis TaxID=2572923 RepID=UPI00138A0084|nr:hypothetical protein [Vibrio taketomensis]